MGWFLGACVLYGENWIWLAKCPIRAIKTAATQRRVAAKGTGIRRGSFGGPAQPNRFLTPTGG